MPVKNIKQRVGSSWLQYLPLIIYIEHLINRPMSSRKFIPSSTNNIQCNCFGNYVPNNQFFLSKPKNTQANNKLPLSHSPLQPAETSSNKNSGKRSLRKNNTSQGQSPPNMFSRARDEYYNSNQSPIQTKRESRLIRQEQTQRSTGSMRQEQKYFTKPPQCNIRNNNLIISPLPIYYSPPIIPIVTSPQRIIVTHSSPPPIRINFRTTSPQPLLQTSSPAIQIKPFSSKSIKNQNNLKQSSNTNNKQQQNVGTQEIIQFELTEDNLDSPRMMPVHNRLEKQPKKKIQNKNNKFSQYFGFTQTFKSNIETHLTNKKEVYKSIIQKNKSNANEYQLDAPQQFKKEKGSLKKINDVQETHSMPNSDDEVQDDNESVVLGRLHEYGSAINPSNSFSATVGSKLVSMNTQSSIGKSYLKSFQFHSDRRP